jgi:CBS domain-containing membrane protein
MRFNDFLPQAVTVNATERWRTVLGAVVGLLLIGLVSRFIDGNLGGSGSGAFPLGLAAPLGASALLVFAVPASPMAQPWAVVGGNVVSALVGVACAHWAGQPLIAGPLALGLSIAAMFALRCLHPPGGAMALLAVLGHTTGFAFALFPVFTGSFLLVLAAIVYNTLTGRTYPPIRPTPGAATGILDAARRFTSADIDAVLANYNQVLDVSRGDLENLLQQAQAVAYRRGLGEIRCAQVMSRNVVKAQFGDSLSHAWALMRQHGIKALPVVDRANRIVGIVTTSDFLRHADTALLSGLGIGLGERLRDFVRPSGKSSSDRPEVVGQIMTRTVRVASADRHIVDLVPLFSQHGHHHIPIVDGEKRLVGIITQTDVVRALFRAVEPVA